MGNGSIFGWFLTPPKMWMNHQEKSSKLCFKKSWGFLHIFSGFEIIPKLSLSPTCDSILTRQNRSQLMQRPGPENCPTEKADLDGEWLNFWVILEISKNLGGSSGKIFKILSQKIVSQESPKKWAVLDLNLVFYPVSKAISPEALLDAISTAGRRTGSWTAILLSDRMNLTWIFMSFFGGNTNNYDYS